MKQKLHLFSKSLGKAMLSLVFLSGFIPLKLAAQTDTVDVPDFFDTAAEGTLNDSIMAATNGGTLSGTVFRLRPFGWYVLTAPIVIPVGEHLAIVAPEPGRTQDTALPQILWTANTSANTAFIFDCFGDITLRNIWLLYANTSGVQVQSSLQIEDSPDSINGQHGTFDGVIFDYSGIPQNAGGAVGVSARHFRGSFTNCYFRNCIDMHFRYHGRAVSFPFGSKGWHIDSLSFENCTFANIGYVYMQEGGEYGDHVHFNHCTFLNTMMYTLESGWWHWLSVTNSIFVNAFMYGDFPAWGDGYPEGGILKIDSIATFDFAVPFTESERHILLAYNSYYIEPWLSDYMEHNPYSDTAPVEMRPHPQPMMSEKTMQFFDDDEGWPFVSRANNYVDFDPIFVFPPTNLVAIKRFLYFKWATSEDTTWAFDPWQDVFQQWPMKELLSYSNTFFLTGAMNGFPLGDMRWQSPSMYNEWKAQQSLEHERIARWLESGVDVLGDATPPAGLVPADYLLHQNFPNPFNPTTAVSYQPSAM